MCRLIKVCVKYACSKVPQWEMSETEIKIRDVAVLRSHGTSEVNVGWQKAQGPCEDWEAEVNLKTEEGHC